MRTFSTHETAWLLKLDGIELAPFWRRALAFALDCLIVLVLFILVLATGTIAFIGWRKFTGHPLPPINIAIKQDRLIFNDKHGTELASVGDEWAHLLYYSLTPVLYFGLITWWTKGRSPGKWLLRIRVLSIVHPRLTFWHSIERALGYGAAILEFGFGFLQFFIHPYRRCAQDRLAETIVVTERSFRAHLAGRDHQTTSSST